MGEKTPEAVEIKCPGCGTYFRLTPKKGRLPTGDVPCPKCFEEIPVEDGRLIMAADSGQDQTVEQPSLAPAFGVTSPNRSKSSANSNGKSADELREEDEAIARLERMAAEMEGDVSSTIAGLPGGFEENPFATSRRVDKTAAVDRSILKDLAAGSSVVESDDGNDRDSQSESSSPRDAWVDARDIGTSPRLVSEQTIERLAQESSEAAIVPNDVIDEEPQSHGLRRERSTRRHKVDPKSLRETAENKSISPEMAQTARVKDIASSSKQPPTTDTKKSQILARIKRKTVRAKPADASSDDSKSLPTAPSISLDKIRKASAEPDEEKSAAESDTAKKPSLAVLFKKAKKGGSKPGSDLREKLREAPQAEAGKDKKASAKLPDDMEISEGELADIVERTTSSAGGLPRPKLGNFASEADDDAPALPRSAKPSKSRPPRAAAPTEKIEKEDTSNSGLFEGFESKVPDGPAPDAIGEVSDRPGQTTTQSMLARLQTRRNRGGNVDAIEVGAAGERRGSGYIRLPTAEIQDVLGQGNYRLKIGDVVYEPVDQQGLIQLIKAGVLLGAEEIAEADGDWMSVSEHPVFGELRDKMAAEAHEVLSRMGNTQSTKAVSAPKKKKEEEVPPEAPPIEAPTAEMSLSETAALASEMIASAPPAKEPPVKEPPVEVPVVEEPVVEEPPPSAQEEVPEPPTKPEPSAPREEEEQPLAVVVEPEEFEPASDDFDLGVSDVPIETTTPKKKSKAGLLAALVVIILAVAGGGLMFTEQGNEILEDLTGWSPELAVSDTSAASDEEQPLAEVDPAVTEAVEGARDIVAEAIPDAFSDISQADIWVRERVEDSAYEDVEELLGTQWNDGRRDRDFMLLYSEVLIENENFRPARRVALKGMDIFGNDDEFVALHRQAVENDASLRAYIPVHLDNPQGYSADGIYDKSGHRGIVLAVDDDESNYLIFKPERSGWQDGWRAEVAAWRLCELIVCHFEILRTEPAIMTRQFLAELGGDTDGLSALMAQASWQNVEIDGQTVEGVWGSLEYIPTTASVPFPIEYLPLWQGWLTTGRATGPLEEELRQHLSGIESLADGRFHEDLMATLGDVQTSEVARQLSSLLLFDFLTNNWERFFTRPIDYGTNNPVVAKTLVSRHNGDAFQPRSSRRVQGRFEWTTRFSQSTVASIRALDENLTMEVLFPEATRSERTRLNVMWSQRRDLLRRVDQLAARHGEEDVLRFP